MESQTEEKFKSTYWKSVHNVSQSLKIKAYAMKTKCKERCIWAHISLPYVNVGMLILKTVMCFLFLSVVKWESGIGIYCVNKCAKLND